MTTIKHILVPTDFSAPSDRALSMAVDLALTFKARITLLHVWSMPNVGYAEALAWPTNEMESAARRTLSEAQARVSERLPDVDTVLQLGRDWQVIIDVAKERAVDLIVMGTHGRHGLPRVILGSVTEKVVRLSPIPVLTVNVPLEETT